MSEFVLPVSVVIPTRDRATLLADTVESIGTGTSVPAEIVIADQGGAPAPASWRVPPGVSVRHVRLHSRGLSAARNAGAAVASEPMLAFTDDDMRADAGWLEALTAALLASGHGSVVTGRVLAGEAEGARGFVPSTVTGTAPATYGGRLGIDVLAGGNMAMRRDEFQQAGGFDERLGAGARFPAAEDNDLGYRLLEAGFRVVYVPDALLIHRAWRPLRDYVPLRFAYGRGKGGFYMKHASMDDLHLARRMGKDLLRRAGRCLRYAHRPRRVAGELAYSAGVVSGAIDWLRHPGHEGTPFSPPTHGHHVLDHR